MPSWNDGESSNPSLLGAITDMGYAPDWIEDPVFRGVVVDCPHLCRVHKLDHVKCVVFEGSNTGRIFYLCSVQNQDTNCGFVVWHDEEWPQTSKNALGRLWGMYDDSNSARIDERIENAKLVKLLSDEKNKIEKKYSSLLADVNKFMDKTEKKVMEENLARIKNSTDTEVEKERNMQKAEVEVVKNAVAELKQIQNSQAECMKVKQNKWDAEKEAFKVENKRLEYQISDMFHGSEDNKEKLKKIKEIANE